MEILGVNRLDEAANNFQVPLSGSFLPWLQDTPEQAVWTRWGITYRDVLILDAFNRPIARDNLTLHDLGNSTNYTALRDAILRFATPADTDQDGLPDDWEIGFFGNLNARPDGDDDGDGYNNATEFAFATNPRDPNSRPQLLPVMVAPGGAPALSVRFHRFSGGAADFVVETSSDLEHWTSAPASILRVGEVVNAYDSFGGANVRYQLSKAAGALSSGFIRVKPVLKPGP